MDNLPCTQPLRDGNGMETETQLTQRNASGPKGPKPTSCFAASVAPGSSRPASQWISPCPGFRFSVPGALRQWRESESPGP